jgi:hypothetical protein
MSIMINISKAPSSITILDTLLASHQLDLLVMLSSGIYQ